MNDQLDAPRVTPLLTKDQACAYLSMSRASLNRQLAQGKVRYYRIGGMVKFDQRQLDDYLKAAERNVDSAKPVRRRSA